MELFGCSVTGSWELLGLIFDHLLFDDCGLKVLILSLLETGIELNPRSSVSLLGFIKNWISCLVFAQKRVVAPSVNYHSSMRNIVWRNQHVVCRLLLLAYLWKVSVLLLHLYSIQVVLRVEKLLALGIRNENLTLRLVDPVGLAVHLLSSLLHYPVSLLQLVELDVLIES